MSDPVITSLRVVAKEAITDVRYNIPVRVAKFKEMKENYESEETIVQETEFKGLSTNKGEESAEVLCSKMVNINYNEWDSVPPEDLSVGLLMRTAATKVICLDVDNHIIHFYKEPNLSSGTTVKLAFKGGVYSTLIGLETIFNYTLLCNFPITITELTKELPTLKLSRKAKFMVDPLMPNLNDPTIVDMSLRGLPYGPLTKEQALYFIRNTTSKGKQNLKTYLRAPLDESRKSLYDLTGGYLPEHSLAPGLYKNSRYPLIKVAKNLLEPEQGYSYPKPEWETEFVILCGKMNNQSNEGYDETLFCKLNQNLENYNFVELLNEEDKSELVDYIDNGNVPLGGVVWSYDEHLDSIINEDTKGISDKDKFLIREVKKVNIESRDEIFSNVSWPAPSALGKENKAFRFLKDIRKLSVDSGSEFIEDNIKEIIDSCSLIGDKSDFLIRNNLEEKQQFEEIMNEKTSDPVKLARALLRLRGNLFENLVRYAKGNYTGEQTMGDFIISLNNENPTIAKQVFYGDMFKQKTRIDLQSFISNTMPKSTNRKELLKKLFTKTPDIINVSMNGAFTTLVVCDPSSGNDIVNRQKTKAVSYFIYKHLINPSNLVDFRLEAPVVDGLGQNIDQQLDSIITHFHVDNNLKDACKAMMRNCTIAFNKVRKNKPSVQIEYEIRQAEINMGVLEFVEFHKYLTDRDLDLAGLNRKEIEEIFSDKRLTYENDTEMEMLERTLKEKISTGTKEKGKAASDRQDVFLNVQDKVDEIKKGLHHIKNEKPDNEDLTCRHDPIGYLPVPNVFSPSKETGLEAALSLLSKTNFGGRESYINVLFMYINSEIDRVGRNSFKDAINMYKNRDHLSAGTRDPELKGKVKSFNEALNGIRIKEKNRLHISNRLSEDWVNDYRLSKMKSVGKQKGDNPLMLKYQKRSVDRIDNFIDELEEQSKQTQPCITELIDLKDIAFLPAISRTRMEEYLETKGSQAMINYHRICFELNILLTQDMDEGEIAISNLGTTNIVAVVSPGPALTSSSTSRHVKFIIKTDTILKGQKFRFEEDQFSGWSCQQGFCKITHKSLLHMLNMKLCLSPLYNEISSTKDSEIDKRYKRSFHQLLWMCGDSTTNKMLGVIRYLFLLVFAIICCPARLIIDELSVNSMVWRRDIHIYIIHQIITNLCTTILEATKIRESATDEGIDGSIIKSSGFKIKRLLHAGYHTSFTEMLNEFYLYYTWNKEQIDPFNGTKKIFNKLIKIKTKCEKYILPCIERLKTSPADKRPFEHDEFHLNTGIRCGLKKNSKPKYNEHLDYLLYKVDESQPGVGYAPFLYYSTNCWFEELNVAENLIGRPFQPLEVGVTDLSNTRGSLERTELIDTNGPIICPTLKRVAMLDKANEDEQKELQRQLGRGEIILEDFQEKLGGLASKGIPEKADEVDVDFDPTRGVLPALDILPDKPTKLKRKLGKLLSKMGYDTRSKCVATCKDELIDAVKKKMNLPNWMNGQRINIDTFILKFVKLKLDMIHGLSPKTQHLSDRELRIMDILSKAGVRVVEDLARFLSLVDNRETTTTEKNKQSAQVRNSRIIDDNCKLYGKFGIKLSADKSKWGPGVLPTEIIPMLRSIMHNMPSLKKVCKLCMFMAIKLQSKRVIVPKVLLTNWWVHDLDLNRLSRTQPELVGFMKSFDPKKCSTFDNINDMGQGILNAFTSLKHLVVTTSSNKIYRELVNDNSQGIVSSCLLSSDDSLEMQTFSKDNLYNDICLWLKTKTCCWRLTNMISNTKKTCGSEALSEYNSNFYLRPICSPPTIKPIIAAGSLNFDYSWADTVRGKLSEIKAASENGVTNNTCLLLNLMTKRIYETIFGINRIKSIIKKVAPEKSSEIINRMETGHIEFGRFPIVDIVRLNIFGSYEVLRDGLNDERQTEILTNLEDNPFFTLGEEDNKMQDFNTIAIKSMHFRLYKISKLDQAREKMKKDLESISVSEEDLDNVLKLNPFCKNIKSQTIGEQLLVTSETLNSSSMQRAFSNFDGLRGMMRVFGLRFSSKYGTKGSITEGCSFMQIMVLMNMATVYELDKNASSYKCFDEYSSEVDDIHKLGCLNKTELVDHKYIYPKPIKVLKEISQESIDSLPIPSTGSLLPNNVAQPTLMLRPAWNNGYMLSDRPVDCLMSLWRSEVTNNMDEIPEIRDFDKFVLTEKFKIEDNYEKTLEQWGLKPDKENYKKMSGLCSWLVRIVENSYKRPRLVFGRATTKQGIRRMANDLYSFNADSDYFIDNIYDEPTKPNKWAYSAEEYDFYSACTATLPLSGSHSLFKDTCIVALGLYNEQLKKDSKKPIVINENIIKDKTVTNDIRFVVSVLKTTQSGGFRDSTKELLKDCVSAKNHNYIVKQRNQRAEDGSIIDSYEKDSPCTMEFYTSTVRMRITCSKGRKPYIEYYSLVRVLDRDFISENVTEFFLSRAHFSYVSGESLIRNKFQKLKPASIPIDKSFSGYYNLESSNLEENIRDYSIPIYLSTSRELNTRPVVYQNLEFHLDWDRKAVFITNKKEGVMAVNVAKKVVGFDGKSILGTLTTNSCKAMVNSMLKNDNSNAKAETLIKLKFIDELSNISLFSNDYSGATIALMHTIKNNKKTVRSQLYSSLEKIRNLKCLESLENLIDNMRLDREQIYTDFELYEIDNDSLPNIVDYEDYKEDMPVTNELILNASLFDNLTFNSTKFTPVAEEQKQEETTELNVKFFFSRSISRLNDKLSRFGEKYLLKWQDVENHFHRPEDNIELNINKVVSERCIGNVLSSINNTIDNLNLEGVNEFDLTREQLLLSDKRSSEAIEMINIISMEQDLPNGKKSQDHYLRYYKRLRRSLSISGIDAGRIGSGEIGGQMLQRYIYEQITRVFDIVDPIYEITSYTRDSLIENYTLPSSDSEYHDDFEDVGDY